MDERQVMKNIRSTFLILGTMLMLAMQARATMYFGRPYDPNLQRWLNRDPIQEAGGINLYRFVHNRPTVEVDPLGFGANTITDGNTSYSSSGSMYGGPDGFAQPGPYYNPSPMPPFQSPLDMLPSGPSLSDAQALADALGQGNDPNAVNGIYNALNLLAIAGIPEGAAGEDLAAAKAAKPSLSDCKTALKKAQDKVGKQPKGKPGKFGSPQGGTPKKGYRLDPGHPDRPPGDPENGPHINWWDYTTGKRGSGGQSGAIPISPDQ